MFEVGAGLGLEAAEAAAFGTLRIVCLDTFAVVCSTCDALLAPEDVEGDEEDVEEVVESVEGAEEDLENVAEVRIAAEDEADVRGVWAEKDPSDSTYPRVLNVPRVTVRAVLSSQQSDPQQNT